MNDRHIPVIPSPIAALRDGMSLVFVSRMHRDGAAPLIGSSAVMRAVRDRIERVAATNFVTLIDGESGTGKELVARQIHEISPRRRGPFVPVNCAALVDTLLEAELFGIEERTATGVRGRRGKFECADGGTLFLDEVADLSLSAQAKLLRVLQDLAVERVGGHGLHRVNTRVVAATNKRLAALVEAGIFRADLFYRLAGIEIHVPPLRERREDILELADYFLERNGHGRHLALSRAAADALLTYDWPGNVRELERMMERTLALVRHTTVEVEDLPIRISHEFGDVLLPSMIRNDTLRAWASRYVRLVLERSGRNKRKACQALGISYHTLQAYLRYAHRLQVTSAHETSPAFGAAQNVSPFDAAQGAPSASRGAGRSRGPE
jgi:transcriptional regulator with PAS, ATPase and Fis domain